MGLRLVHAEMSSFDGAKLHYRAWLPEGKATRAVVLFHRGHEHSGRWEETVAALGMPARACFAWRGC